MSTDIEWQQILMGVGSIIGAGGLALLLKMLFYKYRRPNGKKGGCVSFHVAVAFSIVTVVAITTKDWYLTGLTAVLTYLVARGRLDESQHYMYQVVLGAIIGIGFPFAVFYTYYRYINGDNSHVREEYNDRPERAYDDRHEADEAPELRLDDLDDI